MVTLENYLGLVVSNAWFNDRLNDHQIVRLTLFLAGFEYSSRFFMLREVLTSSTEFKSAMIGSSGAPTRHPLIRSFAPLGTWNRGLFHDPCLAHVPHSDSCRRHTPHHGRVPDRRGLN